MTTSRTSIKYEKIRYWNGEDRVFRAEVPELSGCLTHGDSQESASAIAQQDIQLWIDTSNESGDLVPEHKGRQLMLA